MAAVQSSGLCLGVPIDHRLESLIGTGLIAPDHSLGFGDHARDIENYGRHLQRDRSDITDSEVKFAKWLAMPETKGGVVIVLQQPAEYQRYFPDHRQTLKDCDTLEAVDEVCKVVTGCGLDNISCFDAFPFHKIPISKSLYEYEEALDEAYAIFLDMIRQKQPEVVFCCYRSPHPTKYKDFQSIGVGRIRDYQVTVQGQRYTCVNGFHLSYALNYLEDKSALRNLFVIEAAQAFRRANGTWRESPWMTDVRKICAAIVKIDIEDKEEQPGWTKHDFQRERFRTYMDLIKNILESVNSDAFDDMTDDELYDHILRERYNVVLPNCLLLLVKIIKFEDHGGSRLQDKGFARLHQREERDVRDLRRNVGKRCEEFLRSIRTPGVPFQVEKGKKGLLTSAGLEICLLPIRPVTHQSGLHYHLRLSVVKMVRILNDALIFQGRDVYEVDKNELARAFRIAAGHLEWALGQHAASIRRRAPEEDLAITSGFNLLRIDNNNNTQQTTYAPRPVYQQTRTMQPSSAVYPQARTAQPSSTSYPQSPPFSPSRRPTAATTPPVSWSSVSSSSSAAPRFGVTSPPYSPQATTSSRYRSAPTCTGCNQTGHSSSSCPKTQCYRCKGFGHMSFHCSVYPSTPERRR